MKKLFVLLLSVLLISFCLLSAQAATADAMIVISENATDTEKYAARVLQDYLQQGGLELPIVTDATEKTGFEILVGKTARNYGSFTNTIDGSYRIESIEDGIQIVGAGNRGTVYGTYAFLEKLCGFHWYAADVTVIPEAKLPDMSEDILIEYEPAFEYTDTDWLSPRNDQYSLANGLNGGPYRTLSAEQGGTVDYISNFCHTLATQFCSPDVYFEDHPEYFALHNGIRTPKQLCLSNETVVQIVTDEVLALLAEKHDPTAAVQIVSLTQHDNQEYCQCKNCKAIDDANGSASGSMITFVNRVAAAVKDAGYDNIAIDTFAYQYTRKAPTQVVPLDNVIVRLCTIECCFSHPLNDANCEQNAALKADLENWNAICDRIYVWDYATNYAYTLGLFPDFGVLQSNMQFFRDHGVKGVYEEGNYYMANSNTEFGDLRAYMLSKLLQDPDCDLAAETEGFLNTYYGEGGKAIGRFLQLITENSAKTHHTIYVKMSETLSLTDEEIEICNSCWEEAKAVTVDDPATLARVERSELSWRFWKACNRVSEFKGVSAFRQNRQLYLDILAVGTTQFSEGNTTLASLSEMNTYFRPEKWSNPAESLVAEGISVIAYGAVVLASVALFVIAVQNKKYLYVAHFPLIAVFIEIVMWNRRAYIAWRDLDELALTIILFCGLFAFVGATYAKAAGVSKGKQAIAGITCGVLFIALYFVPTYIVNIVIYKALGNAKAIAAGIAVYSAALLGLLIATTLKIKNEAMMKDKK
ncbi:MAG: DUF4838 domain-containing protein [Clostridia bacterium]|nr:DUF4838 domain-containing protein [Clostridia bacterium]